MTNNSKVLALSSSRVGNGGFLQDALPIIQTFLGDEPQRIAFIPFASVNKDYEAYTGMVAEALKTLPYSIHTVTPENALAVISTADAIMTGGGNTFKLLHDIYELDLLQMIQEKIGNGTPYIGWSAGANITGLSISTTNDMPIIEPKSFKALGLFPFQINPHYFNQSIVGHNGETRDQRLEEFITLNTDIPVVALPEGTGLLLRQGRLSRIGERNLVLFQYSKDSQHRSEISNKDNLDFLINR